MTELQLYKFITNEKLEIHWRGESLILWVDYFSLSEFAGLFGGICGEDDWQVYLQETGIAVDLVPVCEHFDIDPEHIKEKGDD